MVALLKDISGTWQAREDHTNTAAEHRDKKMKRMFKQRGIKFILCFVSKRGCSIVNTMPVLHIRFCPVVVELKPPRVFIFSQSLEQQQSPRTDYASVVRHIIVRS